MSPVCSLRISVADANSCERFPAGLWLATGYPETCLVVQAGTVESPAFTKAFFDLYLGSDPVSEEGKASIARGIANSVSGAGS